MGKTKKRLLALALTAAVSMTLLPGTVYAEETEGEQRTTDPCVITEGCMLENSHEGECRTASINGENSSLMAGGQQEAAFDLSLIHILAKQMECSHQIVSMAHRVEGILKVDGKKQTVDRKSVV